MTAVGPPVPAVGVFRTFLTHLVDPDPLTIDFRGVRLHFGRCGAACVPIVGTPRGRRMWCQDCWNCWPPVN